VTYTRKLAIFGALWLMLISAGAAFADNSKISPDLLPLLSNSSAQINVVVQYSSHPQQTTGLLGGLLGGVVTLIGGVVSTLVSVVYTLIPALAATLQPADIINLSNQSNVVYISLDRPVASMTDYTAGAVDAPTAWAAGLDGSGVGIAIIDSGVYPHADLNNSSGHSRIVYRQSFIGGKLYDDFGHGTHVAGIAGGNGASSLQAGSFQSFKGIAPNANIIDLRVLNANGGSNDSVVISALDKAV